MTTKNRAVADAFVVHQKASSNHVFTDGETIYSYGTHFPLAAWIGDRVLVNGDKYSSSTSHHTHNVEAALGAQGIPYELVDTEKLKKAIERAPLTPEEKVDDLFDAIENEKERG